jgi:hypothetical protein
MCLSAGLFGATSRLTFLFRTCPLTLGGSQCHKGGSQEGRAVGVWWSGNIDGKRQALWVLWFGYKGER